jgi:hypothetical protein
MMYNQNNQNMQNPNMQGISNPNMQGVKNAQPPQRYQVPNAAPVMQNQQPTMGSLSMAAPRSNMQSGQKNAQAPQNYQTPQNNSGGYGGY